MSARQLTCSLHLNTWARRKICCASQMTHEPAELTRCRQLAQECQDSLALALARLEAYRCRERVLTRENQALRAALLQAGVQADAVVKPQQEAAEDIGGPHVRAALPEPDDGRAATQDTAPLEALYIMPTSGLHPIYFNTSKDRVRRPPRMFKQSSCMRWQACDSISCTSQVPGCLIATEEALEFVETRARITASTFLGVRAVDTVSAHAQDHPMVSSESCDARCQVFLRRRKTIPAQHGGNTRGTAPQRAPA